ncbi:MAG TPA: FUSC family protein, partial [Pirellulales bacterium]|nr:FUSC family protein [Pirellulales bacterium]
FVAGMLIAISTHAGDLGLNTLVTVIVFAARGAMSPKGAMGAGLLVLAGGLLQTGFALLFWPVRRYEPERRALGSVYLALSKEVDPHSDVLLSTPLTPPTTEVQDTILALGRDHSLAGERFRLLFDQADRLRLSIYLISRLRDELGEGDDQRSEAEGEAAAGLDSLLRLASQFLTAVAECLMGEGTSGNLDALLEELQAHVSLAQSQKGASAFALAGSIAAAVDVLAGQLRLVAQLAEHTTLQGSEKFARHERAAPLKLQAASWIATLRANLDFRSAICRHAIRLSLCVALGDAIERSLSWQRAYWLPMTIAVVLKPDFTSTFSRGILRLLGTFGGLLLATALYHLLPASAVWQLLLVGVFTFFLRCLGPANYGVFTVAISGLIVFLIAATGVAPGEVIAQRGANTAAGGILALIAYALWPTWERTQVSDAMADMLDSSRLYFRAILQRFASDRPGLDAELDDARRDWRRSRSAAEASVDRVSSEPGTTAAKRECLTAMLASSHALIHAVMGLEAGITQTPIHTPPETLVTFANDVEFTLYFLAAALRGSYTAGQALPELREDYRRMLETRDGFAANDEYVLIETDRLTVSLNTLREQVLRYVRGC